MRRKLASLSVCKRSAMPAGAGLFQLQGWSLGHYYNYSQPGRNRYTALGLDDFGAAQVPLYVGRADTTHVVVGHPVVATGVGASELRIYVTRLNEQPLPSSWHVSVNNPTETMMTAAVQKLIAWSPFRASRRRGRAAGRSRRSDDSRCR